MGALAPFSSWIPEDDLLLKNAVEAGASLESLAKGAVQFSRKFTVRELQERWHSLLYDPVISSYASFRMLELERHATTLSSKVSRAGNSIDNKGVSGKRKVASVRNCYYARRRRICNEQFNPMDLTCLFSPVSTDETYMGDEHFIFEDPYGLQEPTVVVMHHDFPEFRDDISTNRFHAGVQSNVREDYSVEQDNVHKEMPPLCGEGSVQAANGTLIEEHGRPEDFPANVGQINGCSDLNEEHAFGSPDSECSVPFHNFEYSDPLPEMPLWRTTDVASPRYSLPDEGGANNIYLSEFHSHEDANLELKIPGENLKTVTSITDIYLAELSDCLLNFTYEEELLFTENGNDAIDKSFYDGLSSLLLSSPADASQDHVVDIAQPDLNLDHLKDQGGSSHRGINHDEGPHHRNDSLIDSEVQHLASASDSDTRIPEGEGICLLNTEDPEIPSNDDFSIDHFCPQPSYPVLWRNWDDDTRLSPSTVKEHSSNLNTNGRVLTLTQTAKAPPAHSQIIRPEMVSKTGSQRPFDDHGTKYDLLVSSSVHRNVGYADASKDATPEAATFGKLKDETPEMAEMNNFSHTAVDCSMHNLAVSPDGERYPQLTAYDVKQDLDASEHIADAEESSIESDDDVPYFSDIEAMILDMDLDPEDRDLYSSEEVSRYQQLDTKRVIVRLEQGARSYMQRTIASHRAFAVLYGRQSKHFIKKTEVLLGRATEGFAVDIDLWSEGLGIKVSRRQATISLDKNGSFHLRNLGQCPMLVNGKEIFNGQNLSLPSSCLIEIRGMPFVFETNQTRVKQYLDSINQQNPIQEHQF